MRSAESDKAVDLSEHLDSFADRTIWLIGAGDSKSEHDHASLLIDNHIIAAGPGEPGPYQGEPYMHKGKPYPRIGRFHHEILLGDIAVLRVGVMLRLWWRRRRRRREAAWCLPPAVRK